VVYITALLFMGAIGYQLNFGEAGRHLNAHFLEKIVRNELEKTPNDAKLYSTLGDLYFARKQYAETIEAYSRAIQIQPDNAKVLNNLAWLYATCEDEQFRNPKEALRLAEKAAQLEEAAYILDTLAESYYINGMIEAAINAEKEAIRMAQKNHSYYEGQLKKFRENR
jgi:tetratricopeptide (TPR) repeat protein